MKPLKDLVQNKRQMQREMRSERLTPRLPLETAQSHKVSFVVEGDTLKVVGFQ